MMFLMSQHEFTKPPYKGENYGKQSSFQTS
jgi:hypothetical protein